MTHDEVLRQAALRTKIRHLPTFEQRIKLANLRARNEQRVRQRQQQAAPAASHRYLHRLAPRIHRN